MLLCRPSYLISPLAHALSTTSLLGDRRTVYDKFKWQRKFGQRSCLCEEPNAARARHSASRPASPLRSPSSHAKRDPITHHLPAWGIVSAVVYPAPSDPATTRQRPCRIPRGRWGYSSSHTADGSQSPYGTLGSHSTAARPRIAGWRK